MCATVSVCITTYNRATLLQRTLASLAEQTRLPDEVIISDDCSTDETPAVVDSWKDRLPALTYSRNERNLNMPGNLNAAVALARGEYVANLHDADEFAPTLLEKWAASLDAHPSAGFVFCGVAGWPAPTPYGDGIILHDVEPLTPGRAFYETYLLCKMSSIVWGTVMARRNAYDALLPFDAQFGFVSDVDMWMRMCLQHDVAYVREPLLILDHTPTKERGGGKVNWKAILNVHRIQLANIERFFGTDDGRRRRELARQMGVARRYCARRLAGRLWHRDLAGLREGMSVLVKL